MPEAIGGSTQPLPYIPPAQGGAEPKIEQVDNGTSSSTNNKPRTRSVSDTVEVGGNQSKTTFTL